MSSLFSSPGKSASQAASGQQAATTSLINQIEQYTGQQQNQARGGIAGIGANPYQTAAQAMNPANYAINPGGMQSFGSSGPGTYLANPMTSGPPIAGPPGGGAPGGLAGSPYGPGMFPRPGGPLPGGPGGAPQPPPKYPPPGYGTGGPPPL